MAEQSFENHGRFVPAFHFFVIPVAAINFGWQVYRWKTGGFAVDGFESILLAAALLLGFFYARIFALRVQDRIIRLEEQLRCQRLLPADLQRGLQSLRPAIDRPAIRQRRGIAGARPKSAR